MDAIARTVRVDGRVFRVEAVPRAPREGWSALVGEGSVPTCWSRLPLPYDSAAEALAAAADGIVRLVANEARAAARRRGASL